MKNKNLRITFLSLIALTMSFVACQDDNNNNEEEKDLTHAEVPVGAALKVDKDFQSSGEWPSKSTLQVGFSEESDGCDAADMLAVTEAISWEEIYYNGVNNDTVLIDYTDVAVSTTCFDGSGTTEDGDAITGGFVLFPAIATRSGEVTPTVELQDIKTASVVQFSLTVLDEAGTGLSLYKTVDGGSYELVGIYMPESIETGEFYSVAIDESNVSLKFVSEDADNGAIRMHDLKIWTLGVSDDAQLYVNEFFGTWALQGYELPVPGVEDNKTGTQYVTLASTGRDF